MNRNKNIYYNNIIQFLKSKQEYFVNIITKIIQNNLTIPLNIYFYPIYKNKIIDSLIAYNSSGHYYLFIKKEYLDEAARFINNNINHIYSIYGSTDLINVILKKLIS